MKELLKNLNSIIWVLTASILLTACGGSSDDSNKYSISADISSVEFSNEVLQESGDTIEVKVTFVGDGLLLGFAPDAQPAAWLNYRTDEVTENSAVIHIDVVNEALIAPALYTTKLRLSTGDTTNTNLVHHDIDVSLLVWQLTPDTNLVSFGGTFGEESIASQTFELISENNEWSLSTNVDWLTLEPNTGTGNATITVTPNITDFSAPGLNEANITITETTQGDTKDLPVELGLDNVYLYADKASLAFSSTANVKATERIIHINSNSPTSVSWQASSDMPWLAVSRIDETNQVKVSVDPSLAEDNALSNGNITISATDAESIVIADNIEVSLYKNEALTENKALEELTVNNNAMVNAPGKPYFYLGINNELRIYHQYTAELLSTLVVSPEETLLEQLIIHPEGHMLLAKADETITTGEDDEGNPITEVVTHRYQINLDELTVTELADTTIAYEPTDFVHFAGRYYVVTQTLEYADENLQRLFWDGANAYFARGIDIAEQTGALYALDGSNSTFKRYLAKVNDFTTGKISTELSHEYKPELLGEEDAVTSFITTNTDTGIYAISPTSEWISFDGEIFTDNGLLETGEDITTLTLDKSENGRAHYIKFDPTLGFLVDIFDEQQQLATQISTGGNQPTSVDISADDKRMVIDAGNNDNVEVITLEQFGLSANNLAFSTTYGDTAIESQDITLTGIGEGWTASTDADWLVLTPDTSGETPILTVAIDTTKITGWGLFKASISIYDPASGTYSIITIELAVDAIRLSSNYPALAFNSLPSQQTLVHRVDVLSNSENAITWQASSNVSWITLTPDVANNRLTVTAVPANAPTNGLHSGEITLSATDPEQALSGTIAVSLNKGGTDASDVTISDVVPNSAATQLDPVRPYLYVGVGDTLRVYNIVTGELVTTINSPLAGVDLTNLVMHPNGQSMLVSNEEAYTDEEGAEQTRINHYSVNLSSQEISQLDSEQITIEYRPISVKMVAGMPVVVTQTQEFANMALVRQAWDQANAFFSSNLASPNSKDSINIVNNGTSSLEQFQLGYNAYANETVLAQKASSYQNDNFAALSQFRLDSQGTNIYTANSVTEWSSFDGTDYIDNGLLHTDDNITTLNVSIDSANNTYYYRFNPLAGFTLTKYGTDQAEVWTQVMSSGSGTSYLAPDYQRVIHYDSSTSSLVILSMP